MCRKVFCYIRFSGFFSNHNVPRVQCCLHDEGEDYIVTKYLIGKKRNYRTFEELTEFSDHEITIWSSSFSCEYGLFMFLVTSEILFCSFSHYPALPFNTNSMASILRSSFLKDGVALHKKSQSYLNTAHETEKN